MTKASQPASRAPRENPSSAWLVSAMTGMARVRSSALGRRVASQPSMTGSDRSMTMTSGRVSKALASASSPLPASATRKPT